MMANQFRSLGDPDEIADLRVEGSWIVNTPAKDSHLAQERKD